MARTFIFLGPCVRPLGTVKGKLAILLLIVKGIRYSNYIQDFEVYAPTSAPLSYAEYELARAIPEVCSLN